LRTIDVSFILNGSKKNFKSDPNKTLLDVIRDDFGLTGAKDACGGEGECGACTVLMDGYPVNSCLIFVGQAEGMNITTIEGLAPEGEYHPIQEAFVSAGAVQCGYCTPGAVLAVKAILDKNSHPSDYLIKEGLSGNLCRCTGYTKMVDAVQIAAEVLSDD
jgi:carbon-monoxide dehydrogenase small subunit